MRLASRIAPGLLTLSFVAFAAQAGETNRTILVLDASGSMWGQIEGQPKIAIAQAVLRDLLGRMPADQAIGLTAYGHRRKGDCGDIETIAQPASGNRGALEQAIGGLRPKGKTPLSAAVVEAARQLRHTEARATVILVSDGIETCNADPCAVAAELEASGVDFTAHVVGFDVDDAAATAQLQCVAAETGGTYHDARTAEDLSRALEDVTRAAPDPEPQKPVVIIPPIIITGPDQAPAGTFVRFEIEGDSKDQDFLAVYDADGEQQAYVTMVHGASARIQMPTEPGSYEMRYLSEGDDAHAMATHPIRLTEAEPSLSAPPAAATYAQIEVTWTGPGTEWDFLAIAHPDDGGGYVTASDYLTTGGNPITITMPDSPGTYELRYIYGQNREILVSVPITAE